MPGHILVPRWAPRPVRLPQHRGRPYPVSRHATHPTRPVTRGGAPFPALAQSPALERQSPTRARTPPQPTRLHLLRPRPLGRLDPRRPQRALPRLRRPRQVHDGHLDAVGRRQRLRRRSSEKPHTLLPLHRRRRHLGEALPTSSDPAPRTIPPSWPVGASRSSPAAAASTSSTTRTPARAAGSRCTPASWAAVLQRRQRPHLVPQPDHRHAQEPLRRPRGQNPARVDRLAEPPARRQGRLHRRLLALAESGRGPYEKRWRRGRRSSPSSSSMRFTNVDANPQPKDLKVRYSAWGEKALRVPYYRDPLMTVTQEPSTVRLPDKSLFCVMRTNSGYIWYSVSKDDGENWCSPRPLPAQGFRPAHPSARILLPHLSARRRPLRPAAPQQSRCPDDARNHLGARAAPPSSPSPNSAPARTSPSGSANPNN